jgi:GrpB-like predicted nucleotidyltransferase (UPF0157 family)
MYSIGVKVNTLFWAPGPSGFQELEHIEIGGTAVSGLDAKQMIDMMAATARRTIGFNLL